MKFRFFLFFLCVVFPPEDFASAVDEEIFLRNIAIKRQQLRDKLSNVIDSEERAEIYDQLLKAEVKGLNSGKFVLHIWAEALLRDSPTVIEIAINKMSHRMGGFRQDVLAAIATVVALAPGRIYVPEEVIDMLQAAGWELDHRKKMRAEDHPGWRFDYKQKLREDPPLSNSSEDCYYALLSISPGASSEEIKDAYRKAAMQFHPDRNPGDPSAEGKFKSRKKAYDILKDPNKRKAYDIEHGFL